MSTALAECDRCGARMPLREAFTRDELTGWIGRAITPRYEPLVAENRCACGGTLREDVSTTLAALREVIKSL